MNKVGRPTKGTARRDKILNLRLHAWEYERLRVLAESNQVSVSVYLRWLIRREMDR